MQHTELMEKGILILGFAAQGLFFARFLVQWITSERAGRSVVPLTFWLLSVAGGGLLLLYAVFRKDPVFIAGQAGGLVIYLRNLFLIYKERAQEKANRGTTNRRTAEYRILNRGSEKSEPQKNEKERWNGEGE